MPTAASIRLVLRYADEDGYVHFTHQSLAAEIGAAREGISRAPKRFEREGWVQLHRGQIRIKDFTRLRRLTLKRAW